MTDADINWRIWAAVIAKKYNANEFENAIESGPPVAMIQYFSHVPETERQHISQLQRSYRFSRELLTQIKEILEVLEDLAKQRRSQREFQRAAEERSEAHFNAQLHYLSEVVQRELRLAEAFGTAVGPVENEILREAYRDIPDSVDADHAIH